MSLQDDLLEQAPHLAGREPRRPKQASLRRAVSTTYYALFHLLIAEALQIISWPQARPTVARTFAHDEMKQACESFANDNLPPALSNLLHGAGIPEAIKDVAKTFVALQGHRHDADYSIDREFTRFEVEGLIRKAEDAFEKWDIVRADPAAKVFLLGLLFRRRLRG